MNLNQDIIRGLPFVGNKFRLLPQLLPHLNRPQFTRIFDGMCGGGCVGINTDYKDVLMNDINSPLMGIHRNLYEYPSEVSIELLEAVIQNDDFKRAYVEETGMKAPESYVLNAENKEAYLLLRHIWNHKLNDAYILLALTYHSFQNMMRFSTKQDKTGKLIYKQNVPFGSRTFNSTAKENLIAYIDKLRSKTIAFRDLSIGLWDFSPFDAKTLTYIDKPYSLGGASYNAGWGVKQDKLLYELLDSLNERGVKFAVSESFKNNGKQNTELMNWSKRYDVVYLEADYSNSYYTRSKAKTQEVLIKNYE